MAFHSEAGTEDKSIVLPYFWLSSASQTHVLISYKEGYRGHTETGSGVLSVSMSVALMADSPRDNGWSLTVGQYTRGAGYDGKFRDGFQVTPLSQLTVSRPTRLHKRVSISPGNWLPQAIFRHPRR